MRRITLRQLGEAVGVEIIITAADRAGFDQYFDLPLSLLTAQFRSEAAFRAYVRRKLDDGFERGRIARIFDLPLAA